MKWLGIENKTLHQKRVEIQGQVVSRSDNATKQINHCPADE